MNLLLKTKIFSENLIFLVKKRTSAKKCMPEKINMVSCVEDSQFQIFDNLLKPISRFGSHPFDPAIYRIYISKKKKFDVKGGSWNFPKIQTNEKLSSTFTLSFYVESKRLQKDNALKRTFCHFVDQLCKFISLRFNFNVYKVNSKIIF